MATTTPIGKNILPMAMVMPGGDRFMALFYPHDPNEWMVDFMEQSRKKSTDGCLEASPMDWKSPFGTIWYSDRVSL